MVSKGSQVRSQGGFVCQTANVEQFYPEELLKNFKLKHNLTRFAFLKAYCSCGVKNGLAKSRRAVGNLLKRLYQ